MRKILIGVVAAVVVLCTACITEATYTGNPGGHTVAIIGDGITYNAKDELHGVLDPVFQVRLAGNSSTTAAGMQSIATDYAASNPEAVVLNIGTYDLQNGVTLSALAAEINTMIAKFPNSCVVLTTLNTHTTAAGYDTGAAGVYNILAPGAADRIVNWNDAVNDDIPTYLAGPDNLLPTAAGEQLLASLTSQAVSSCFGSGE